MNNEQDIIKAINDLNKKKDNELYIDLGQEIENSIKEIKNGTRKNN